MSEYLVDTNVLLMTALEPARLSKQAQRVLQGDGLHLSVACYWEVIIKFKKGVLDIPDPAALWHRGIESMRARVMPISARHVAALQSLPDHHKDPFDRIIIAQAMVEGLTIVTSDALMARYPVKTIW